jgi:hypothetical protein
MTRLRGSLALLTLAVVAAACTGGDGVDEDIDLDTSYAASMASTWHYVGGPQRVQVGVVASGADGVQPVTQGSIELAFAFVGDGGGDTGGATNVTATYVPVPGTPGTGDAPTVIDGASGVYEAEDVTFDRPGLWRTRVILEIDGVRRELTAEFPVDPQSRIPAPGMRAPRTDTLTLTSRVRPGAIDSMADGGGEIPDPELHEISIAQALDRGRPTLVLFGTPAYCQSRFCGPEVTTLQRIAAEHPQDAEYVHVEIWKEYRPNDGVQVVNEGAADWLLRERAGAPEMTEPWLYLIGPDGIILERWGPLFDVEEVEAALEALPPAA